MRRFTLAALLAPLLLGNSLPAQAADAISILFVGNSYTFSRVDPVPTLSLIHISEPPRPY